MDRKDTIAAGTAKRTRGKTKFIFLGCIIGIIVILLASIVFSNDTVIDGVVDGFTVTFINEDEVDAVSATYSNGVLTARTGVTESCSLFKAHPLKLTFTNDGTDVAGISFDYAITGDGTCKIDNVDHAENGSFMSTVAPGASVTIDMTCPDSENSFEQIVLTNIEAIDCTIVRELTFVAAEGGSITANGAAVNDSVTISTTFDQGVAVTATPAGGYKFLYWLDADNTILSKAASVTLNPLEDAVVHALFIPATDTPAVFCVDDTAYFDFDDAVAAAVNSQRHTVALACSTTFSEEEYAIPSGVTFLVPFDNNYFTYTTKPALVYGSHSTPSPFVTLTLAEGTKLTVENGGTLSVCSKLSAVGQGAGSWNGTPTGKHGRIDLAEGSKISVEDGGALYCYGYIAGAGDVEALSGATVWEAFQIRSWRGGSASTNSGAVFFLNQYYVQNIEAKLTLYAGASEHVFAALNASGAAYSASAVFIGEGGLFGLANGSVSKYYDGARDRLIFDVNGDLDLHDLTLHDLPLISNQSDISTSDYESLPINSNITINVNSGNTSIGVNISFLPGCEIFVDEDATLEIEADTNVFLYDADNWGPYAGAGLQLVNVGYSTVNGTRNVRTTDDLTDVILDVNGTITVNGALYTTGDHEDFADAGADIISSGKTGTVIFNAAEAGTTTATIQMTQSGTDLTFIDIPVTSAKLHNADGTYTLTDGAAAGDTFVCLPSGNWYNAADVYSVTASVDEASAGDVFDIIVHAPENDNDAAAVGVAIVLEGYTAISGEWLIDGTLSTFYIDSLLAAFMRSADDPVVAGDIFKLTVRAEPGTTHSINVNVRAKTRTMSTDEFLFNEYFDVDVAYNDANDYFTITYKNYNGDPIGTEQVQYGQMPLGPSEMPVKAADANFEYEFASWYPKLAEATQDATYTAEFCAVIPGGATVDDEFDFKARSLTLYESISVNYKLAPADLTAAGYSDAYVVVTLNNSGAKITAAANLDSSGRLVYQFKRLSPEYINTTLYAVIYATKDGQLYRSPVREYSVATYCYNTLNKYATNSSYAVLRTLLVDLLHYGACSQQYVGYRTGDLADAALTEAQLAQGTNTVPEMTNLESYTVNTDTPLATWSGRGLRLEDGVNIRLTFHLDTGDNPATSADLKGLYVKVTNDAGKTWTIRRSAFSLKSGTTNDFQFYFKSFNFSMLSDAFYFTVYNAADEPISDTLRYSVETYVEKQYNKASNPAKLKNLVLSILRLGNSAKAWNNIINPQ